MKLYLSSFRVPSPEELFSLLGKPAQQCRIAIVPNAKDYKLPEARAASLDELIVYLSGWGFRCEVVDLREYEDPEALYKTLKPFDMLWAAGGNTFVLRCEMQRSGLDQCLNRLIDEGIVYGGESAGAIVAGSSLRGFEVADDPELADKIIYQGIGLVDKTIAPHMDSPDFVEYTNHITKLYGQSDGVVYLNDNQAFIVNGSDQKIITAS